MAFIISPSTKLAIESHIIVGVLFLKENTTEVNNMSRELKGDNGQIVGSNDYFKRLNEDNKLTFYLRNRDSFDYYYDLK